MNNTRRENGTMAGPLIFTVPAYGFVMALYLDWLGADTNPGAVSAYMRGTLKEAQTGFRMADASIGPSSFAQNRERLG